MHVRARQSRQCTAEEFGVDYTGELSCSVGVRTENYKLENGSCVTLFSFDCKGQYQELK